MKPRFYAYAPDYGDDSVDAQIFWATQALREYERSADGGNVSVLVRDHARERVPAVRAKLDRLEGRPLRVIDGGAR